MLVYSSFSFPNNKFFFCLNSTFLKSANKCCFNISCGLWFRSCVSVYSYIFFWLVGGKRYAQFDKYTRMLFASFVIFCAINIKINFEKKGGNTWSLFIYLHTKWYSKMSRTDEAKATTSVICIVGSTNILSFDFSIGDIL